MTIELEKLLKAIIASGDSIDFKFDGNSMLPTIYPGCSIVVEPMSETPVVGNIYVFIVRDYKSPRLFCHRLRYINSEWLTFRGDNREYNDNPVHISDIIGICRHIDR